MNVVMGAVSIAVLSFLGFDGISTLAEETKEGSKVIGRACVTALLTIGALFIIQTWVAALIWPNFRTFDNSDTAFYQIAELAGGTWLKTLTILATAFSWGITNALVAQAAISRIIYSMARDRKLPSFLAKVHPTFKTPYLSTLMIAFISLIVTAFFASQIDKLSSVVNFGALSSFLFLHLSVMNYYLRKKHSKDYFRHLLLPLVGFLIIGYVWINLDPLSKKLGFIWLVIGIVYLIILKFMKKGTTLDFEEEESINTNT